MTARNTNSGMGRDFPSRSPPNHISITTILHALSHLTVPPRQSSPNPNAPINATTATDPSTLPNDGKGTLQHLSEPDRSAAQNLFLTLQVLFPHHLLPALDLLDRRLLTRMSLVSEPGTRPGSVSVPLVDDSSTIMNLTTETETDTATATHTCQSLSEIRPDWEDVYYIQSSSAQLSRGRGYRRARTGMNATFYEVRLDSWNCTCPAFAVDTASGLGRIDGDPLDAEMVVAGASVEEAGGQDQHGGRVSSTWRFGGTSTLVSSREMGEDDHGDGDGGGGKAGIPVCKHILAAVLAKAAPGLFGGGVHDRIVTREELVGWGGGWGELGG